MQVQSNAALQDSLRAVPCTLTPFSSTEEIAHGARTEGSALAALLKKWKAFGDACPYNGMVGLNGFCSRGAALFMLTVHRFNLQPNSDEVELANELLDCFGRLCQLSSQAISLGNSLAAQWATLCNHMTTLVPLSPECCVDMPWHDGGRASQHFAYVLISQVGQGANRDQALIQLAPLLMKKYPLTKVVLSEDGDVVSLVVQLASLLDFPTPGFCGGGPCSSGRLLYQSRFCYPHGMGKCA
mmetsp:Transcript_5690/g.16797  ORF Transcript_5690/g.16797 Transcript_5690/m.16797 type:complete len:241 (-) Transcript_5690:302-1024(-)